MKKFNLITKVINSLMILSLFSPLLGQVDRPSKPNIIVLLIDDLGWQDVQSYDVDKPTLAVTPNIDALANKGVLFRQAYSPAPTCTPSRAAIVSGMHPARSQCTHINGGTLPKSDVKKDHLIIPWYSGRMTVDQPSIASALKAGGYSTGMTGKWHNSANLYSYPQPEDVGFDLSTHNKQYMLKKYGSHVKGIQEDIVHPGSDKKGKKNDAKTRPIDYSDDDSKYHLDENGYPVDPIQVETLEFIKNNKDKPFFLYNASWLVHAPIQCRSEKLVMKYYDAYVAEMKETNKKRKEEGEKALPIEPLLDIRWSVRGKNPFYLGMIETMDYYVGQTVDYLKTTDDPRWPGHKLIENTYIILTSDNGGVISARAEQITDNAPLRMGKKYTNEGGIRVPFIISGPEIPRGVDSNVMINGLDIYPTVLNWAGLEKEKNTILDGADLSTLLKKDPTDDNLVKDSDGEKRTKMFWHFPHATHPSTIVREGGYKLIMNYGHEYSKKLSQFELYRLYDNEGKRQDIEEEKSLNDLAIVEKMHQKIERFLQETNATRPYFNPASTSINDGKNQLVPEITDTKSVLEKEGIQVLASFKENGAKVTKSYVVYKLVDEHGAEWFRNEMAVDKSNYSLKGQIPANALAAVVTAVDENDFLIQKGVELKK